VTSLVSRVVSALLPGRRRTREAPESAGGTVLCAALDVLEERARQVSVEGWDPDHDDEVHDDGELARAAACYALGEAGDLWPWDIRWWKPKDRRRDLVRAGALIVAEIECLDRATVSTLVQEEGD